MKLIFYYALLLIFLLLIIILLLWFGKNSSEFQTQIRRILRRRTEEFLIKHVPKPKLKIKNMNNYFFPGMFGHVFYINLKNRKDRKEALLKNLHTYGFKDSQISRFPAIYDKNGAKGCLKSHYLLSDKISSINNFDKFILIIEDDFFFRRSLKDINESFHNFLRKIPDWDVFLLNCNTQSLEKERIVDDIYRVKKCQAATAYIVNPNYIRKYTDFLKISVTLSEENEVFLKEMIVDIFWQYLQRVDNWYVCLPLFGAQTKSYSDIEKKKVDYAKYFK